MAGLIGAGIKLLTKIPKLLGISKKATKAAKTAKKAKKGKGIWSRVKNFLGFGKLGAGAGLAVTLLDGVKNGISTAISGISSLASSLFSGTEKKHEEIKNNEEKSKRKEYKGDFSGKINLENPNQDELEEIKPNLPQVIKREPRQDKGLELLENQIRFLTNEIKQNPELEAISLIQSYDSSLKLAKKYLDESNLPAFEYLVSLNHCMITRMIRLNNSLSNHMFSLAGNTYSLKLQLNKLEQDTTSNFVKILYNQGLLLDVAKANIVQNQENKKEEKAEATETKESIGVLNKNIKSLRKFVSDNSSNILPIVGVLLGSILSNFGVSSDEILADDTEGSNNDDSLLPRNESPDFWDILTDPVGYIERFANKPVDGVSNLANLVIPGIEDFIVPKDQMTGETLAPLPLGKNLERMWKQKFSGAVENVWDWMTSPFDDYHNHYEYIEGTNAKGDPIKSVLEYRIFKDGKRKLVDIYEVSDEKFEKAKNGTLKLDKEDTYKFLGKKYYDSIAPGDNMITDVTSALGKGDMDNMPREVYLRYNNTYRQTIESISNGGVTEFGEGNHPIAVRQNNPGNIERNDKYTWSGEINTGKGRFKTFKSMEDGFAGIFRNLIKGSGYFKRGNNTLTGIINTWAPSFENDTVNYIKRVSSDLGISPYQEINPNDKETMVGLAKAIFAVEAGKIKTKGDPNFGKFYADVLDEDVIRRGYDKVNSSTTNYSESNSSIDRSVSNYNRNDETNLNFQTEATNNSSTTNYSESNSSIDRSVSNYIAEVEESNNNFVNSFKGFDEKLTGIQGMVASSQGGLYNTNNNVTIKPDEKIDMITVNPIDND